MSNRRAAVAALDRPAPAKHTVASDSSKKLTPEEQAFVDNIRNAPQRRWAERRKNIPYYFVYTFLLLVLYACASVTPTDNVAHTRYADCETLSSPVVHNVVKLKILSSYLPGRPICSLKTPYYTVNQVFFSGTRQVQIVLQLNREHRYALDGKGLMLALLPDKDRLEAGEANGALLQFAGMLNDMSSGNIDVQRLISLMRSSGAAAGYVAENAAALKAQLLSLPDNYEIPPSSVLIPVWLDTLASLKGLKPATDTRLAPAAPAPSYGATPSSLLGWLKQLGKGQ